MLYEQCINTYVSIRGVIYPVEYSLFIYYMDNNNN